MTFRHRGAATGLIGRCIFTWYLFDRGIVDGFRPKHWSGDLADRFATPEAAFDLFDWLRSTFNGDLFPMDDPGAERSRLAVHTKPGVKRYRYYVSRAELTKKGEAGSLPRVPAGVLEQFLAERLSSRLAASWRPDLCERDRLVLAVSKVTLSQDQIVVCMADAALAPGAAAETDLTKVDDAITEVKLTFHMRRRQGALILEATAGEAAPKPKVDQALVRALVLAKGWAVEIEAGRVASIAALATREQLCTHYTARLLPLAYLAPDIVECIAVGRQPRTASLAKLIAVALPADWEAQRALFKTL